MPHTPKNISEVQHKILDFIKGRGKSSTAEIADRLKVSYEAVRQQLRQLELGGYVVPEGREESGPRAGRPTQIYSLSPLGDHFFPKAYDELVVKLIDILPEALGAEALEKVLTHLTDENVARWEAALEGKSLEERLKLLKGFYLEDDPHMEIARDKGGKQLSLVEKNCPFLNVASRRPALCSVTVATLTRLLGYQITREKRFQNGDGRCVFRVHLDRPVKGKKFRFAFEST